MKYTDTYQTEGFDPGPTHLVKASSPAAGESPVLQIKRQNSGQEKL